MVIQGGNGYNRVVLASAECTSREVSRGWVETLRSCREPLQAALLLTLSGGVGCGPPLRPWFDTRSAQPPKAAAPGPSDSPFEARATRDQNDLSSPDNRIRFVHLSVVHIRCPEGERDRLEKMWNHLREDIVESSVQLRLTRNGFRAGVGHAQDWEAIKAILDGIEGCTSNSTDPVQLPEFLPIDLELDQGARDQTLFAVEPDGILSGATFTSSRNVLRVAFTADVHSTQRVRLFVQPAVQQELAGFDWVRTASGMAQVPRRNGRTFTTAAFHAVLGESEFLVIGPSRQAATEGLVGRAFLADQVEGSAYVSCILLRPAIPNAKQPG